MAAQFYACPFCGSRVAATDMFCSGCGKSAAEIRAAIAAQQQAYAQPAFALGGQPVDAVPGVAVPAAGAPAAAVSGAAPMLVAAQPAGATCPSCGAPIGVGDSFCMNCGTPIAAAAPGVVNTPAGSADDYTADPGPAPSAADEAAGSAGAPADPAPTPDSAGADVEPPAAEA